MFQMFIGIALLGLIAIPILILILFLYQNLLIENVKPKAKQEPIRTKSYYTDSNELVPARLKIVK